MKKGLIAVVVLLAIIVAFFFFGPYFQPTTSVSAPDYKNISYRIDNRDITLKDGISEIDIVPGSASKLITKYFGNEAVGDLNGDGIDDIAFILTQSGGGSGTFYYVVVALRTGDGYQGTNAVLLGDRVAPQTTEVKNGELVVNYADRKPGESMATAPSVGVSTYLVFSGTMLVEAPAAAGAEFNTPITIRVNGKITFSDGLLLSVKEINDSRCKPDVVCVWQGELALVLVVSRGKFATSSEEIRLGTVNSKSISVKGYTFSLESATENSATIIVAVVS